MPLYQCLSEDAEPSHILQAVLEAAYLRRILETRLREKHHEHCRARGGVPSSTSLSNSSGASHTSLPELPVIQLWDTVAPLMAPGELEECAVEARQAAHKNLGKFLENLHQKGWRTRTMLLSTSEKVRFVKL